MDLLQQKLSMAFDKADHEAYLERLSQDDRATLLSEMLPGVSNFLQAVPSKEFGTAWEPAEFLVEFRMRLFVNDFKEDSWCPL